MSCALLRDDDAPSTGASLSPCAVWLLAAALLATAGCDRTPTERCQELQAAVDAKAAALPRSCKTDLDCFIVEVRPAWYVAVSAAPHDAELGASVDALRSECDAPDALPNVFGAGCFEFAGGVADETERQCALTYDGQPIDLATTDVAGLDTRGCDCAVHDDCASSELCQAGCQCKPRCEAGCGQADDCGPETVAALGMGSDLATCVDVCQVNLFDEALQAQVLCLSTATCPALEACFQ